MIHLFKIRLAVAYLKNVNLKLIRTPAYEIFQCQDLKVAKLVTSLRLGLSYLCEHNFKGCFQDAFNIICGFMDICFDVVTISHFFFSNLLRSMLNDVLS